MARTGLAWRCWWIATVCAVTVAHLLKLFPSPPRKSDYVERIVIGSAVVSGLLLLSLALAPQLTLMPHPVYMIILAPFGVGAILGTILVWWRRRDRKRSVKPMPPWARPLVSTAVLVGVFLGGFYVGGGGGARKYGGIVDMFSGALAGLTPEEVDAQVHADFRKFWSIHDALDDFVSRSAVVQKEIKERRLREERAFYLPEEEDRIRWLFVGYLSKRTALLRLVGTYADFRSVRDPDCQARCFMLGYASGITAMEYALDVIARFGEDPALRRKLNEPEPSWGLRAGTFDRIVSGATHEGHLRVLAEMEALYEHHRVQWREEGVWSKQDFDRLEKRIGTARELVHANAIGYVSQWTTNLLDRMKADVYRPVYQTQSIVSTWIGDTQIVQEKPIITASQIRKEIAPRLRPGDIILERRNWYLSNAFLPGFWPHAALYVGTAEDIQALGIADHPEVKARWATFTERGPEGGPHTVIESISEGVSFNTLTHSAHADNVAVLRPRLSREEIAQAIVRAFSHQGKPYDFEFDFFTSDQLVCTELVYRAYEGMLHFPLIKVMGRDTLPAVEIVRQYARQRGSADQELDFVLFLDGDRKQGEAHLATEEEFCSSADRAALFHQ